jgi:hypothetical protein
LILLDTGKGILNQTHPSFPSFNPIK